MDVTLRHTRPREIPVSKPSAEQQYIPKALLRADEVDKKSGIRWLPNGKQANNSKHVSSMDEDHVARLRLAPVEPVNELDIERLNEVEDEITYLEGELDHFINDFYVAAASFAAQADAQKELIKHLRLHPTGKPSP